MQMPLLLAPAVRCNRDWKCYDEQLLRSAEQQNQPTQRMLDQRAGNISELNPYMKFQKH